MHVISAFPKTVLWIGTFVGSIGFAPTIGNAQTARIEVHPFQTMTLTDKQFLTGAKDGKPVVIAGELRIPRPGTDRLPAVVLVPLQQVRAAAQAGAANRVDRDPGRRADGGGQRRVHLAGQPGPAPVLGP